MNDGDAFQLLLHTRRLKTHTQDCPDLFFPFQNEEKWRKNINFDRCPPYG